MEKKFVIILLVMIIAFACSEEKKLEVLSSEAFAYSLDSGWELNASINVIGFVQKEEEDETYSSKLSYFFHLVTPENDTLYEADYGYIDKHEEEELTDIQIESQMELDSSFAIGKYTVIYEVTDDYSSQTVSAVKTFELTAE